MAALTAASINLTGTVEAAGSAASGGGDTMPCGNSTFLRVVNGGGSPITVTLASPTPSNYGVIENVAVVVTNATTALIGPVPAQRFASSSDGLCHVTYSGVTSVTVSAFTI